MIRASTQAELRAISELLHDHWIPLDAIVFDSGRAELTIGVWTTPEGRVMRAPSELLGQLVIRNVSAWSSADSQGINTYDVQSIEYTERAATLSVLFNIPATLRVAVESLDVSWDAAPFQA